MTSDDLRVAAQHAFGRGSIWKFEQRSFPESKPEEALSFSDSLVGVLVNVLEQEEDVDGQEQVLLVTKSNCWLI